METKLGSISKLFSNIVIVLRNLAHQSRLGPSMTRIPYFKGASKNNFLLVDQQDIEHSSVKIKPHLALKQNKVSLRYNFY